MYFYTEIISQQSPVYSALHWDFCNQICKKNKVNVSKTDESRYGILSMLYYYKGHGNL